MRAAAGASGRSVRVHVRIDRIHFRLIVQDDGCDRTLYLEHNFTHE